MLTVPIFVYFIASICLGRIALLLPQTVKPATLYFKIIAYRR
jgi:hypothetical protein